MHRIKCPPSTTWLVVMPFLRNGQALNHLLALMIEALFPNLHPEFYHNFKTEFTHWIIKSKFKLMFFLEGIEFSHQRASRAEEHGITNR